MLKVYFDHGACTTLIAVFADEETYIKCLPILEAQAEECRSTLVESCEPISLDEVIK